MFKSVISGGVYGIGGKLITVEADVSHGFPAFLMVGYLASEVKEAKERVITAIKNTGTDIPPRRIVVNMAPADIRKQGTVFDLAIAVAMLAAMEKIPQNRLSDVMFVGELGLQGRVIGVRGILSLAMLAKENNIPKIMVPLSNEKEASAIAGVEVIAVETLQEAVSYLKDGYYPTHSKDDCTDSEADLGSSIQDMGAVHDFAELMGQERLKRAIQIAIAGGHHLLIAGPPGVGKSMAAKCIPSVLSKLSAEEQMEVTRIHSVAGLIPQGSGLVVDRPFRTPHHSASGQSIVGGGHIPVPGEISLAHCGVLFLDELTEFNRRTIEMLRQPLEDGAVTISRVHGNYRFPARATLIAAMNPCPCGYFPDRDRCRCTTKQIKAYLNRVSLPMLDRFDLTIEASPVRFDDLHMKKPGMTSRQMRQNINCAREIQKERFKSDTMRNSQMDGEILKQFCCPDSRTLQFLKTIYKNEEMSTRAYCKLLRTARTIADLEASAVIKEAHIYEAVSYRMLDRRYWREI